MNLAIFDIDGTLVNSIAADDECFIQTFKDLFQINLSQADWSKYEHVTDSGLTREIFLIHKGRLPTGSELDYIQDYFFKLIASRAGEFNEIPGAAEFIKKLEEQSNVIVAFATGGWRRTALLKLRCLNLPMDKYVLRSADDHFKRTEITKLAITDSALDRGVDRPESITYFGDGSWDFEASAQLNIDFVGVDYKSNGKLDRLGAKVVIKDFLGADASMIIKKAGF